MVVSIAKKMNNNNINNKTAAELAEIIKSTHRRLRKLCRRGESFDSVWSSHCSNTEDLKAYAEAMHVLATQHWEKSVQTAGNTSRITWTYNALVEYYYNGMRQKCSEKEVRKVQFLMPQLLHVTASSAADTPASDTPAPDTPATDTPAPDTPAPDTSANAAPVSATDAARNGVPALWQTKIPVFDDRASLQILDVGSCYNPFSRFPDLQVTAVDLLPATENVRQCDFLNLEIYDVDQTFGVVSSNAGGARRSYDGERHRDDDNETPCVLRDARVSLAQTNPQVVTSGDMISVLADGEQMEDSTNDDANSGLVWSNNASIRSLASESFDAVLFCLLLEYIPSPEQRLLCCQKAYRLLQPEGLLVIITPDSKHIGSNVFLYKCWQAALASVGFARVKYEKQEHFHGMVYRKGLYPEVWKAEAARLMEDIRKKKDYVESIKHSNLNKSRKKFAKLDLDVVCKGLLIPQDLQNLTEEERPTQTCLPNKRENESSLVCSHDSKKPKLDDAL